jgi:hypothetical protein
MEQGNIWNGSLYNPPGVKSPACGGNHPQRGKDRESQNRARDALGSRRAAGISNKGLQGIGHERNSSLRFAFAGVMARRLSKLLVTLF